MLDPTLQLVVPELASLIRSRAFADVREVLASFQAVDIAEILGTLDVTEAAVAFRLLHRELAGDVLSYIEFDQQEQLLEALGDEASVKLLEAMEPDDRAELLDDLPVQFSQRLAASMSDETLRETQAILGYPPDTVGRLMTPDYVRLRPEWTVSQALDHIRLHGRDAETVHWIYVVDQQGRLIDDIHIRRILLAHPEARIQSLMDDQYIALRARDDREEAVALMNRYDRTALPVLDRAGVLLGIVTIDDVGDVAEEEATEDIQRFAGMEALDRPYIQARVAEMVRKRAGVLSVLFIGQMVTIGVLGIFEDKLRRLEVLILFIPLIIASGGNTGTQTASLLVRAIALNQVGPRDWWKVLSKEVLSAVGIGVILGTLGMLAVIVWNLTPVVETEIPVRIGLAVGAAIAAIVLWAVVLGAMFPLLLDRLGFDPATISSPLVATLMDVSGLLIYFVVATILLGL
ncbi:MAG: magnesium transporter [Phycisphaerales bacterium]|nr:magnesium transporter [Phycisphaerales bacterium]